MVLKIIEEKIIKIPEAIIHSRPDGIVHVTFNEKTEFDIPLQLKMLELYIEICGDEKRPFIFSAFNDVIITKEARENSSKIEHRYPGIATALIANSLPYRLIANFYLQINKPKTPYKIFKDLTSAEAWLQNYL